MATYVMLQSLQFSKLIYSNSMPLSGTHIVNIGSKVFNNFLKCRGIKYDGKFTQDSEVEKTPKKKTVPVPKITLLMPNNTMIITNLNNAEKLAKRRNFELNKVTDHDTKTKRAVYKLNEVYSDVKSEDNESAATAKTEKKEIFKYSKLFTIKSTITDHDLRIKINNINRLLDKRHIVKVVLHHSNDNWENIATLIKSGVKGKMNQIVKAQSHVYSFLPVAVEDDPAKEKDN